MKKKATKNKTAPRGAFVSGKKKGRFQDLRPARVSLSHSLANFFLDQFEFITPEIVDDFAPGAEIVSVETMILRRYYLLLDPSNVLARTREMLAPGKFKGARAALIRENRATIVELRELAKTTIACEESQMRFRWKTR
jgi:hypothetical protein